MAAPALMLAMPGGDPETTIRRLDAEGGWSFEFKADGIRALVSIGNKVRITNRRAVNITYRYPDVVDRLQDSDLDLVLDGEIVCTGTAGLPDFSMIHRRDAQGTAFAARQLASTFPATFMAFDILLRDGVDLRALDYAHRREQLEELAEPLGGGAVVAPVSDDGPKMWRAVCAMRMEGLVAKRRTSRYVGRRSPDWVKIKRTHRLSALVSGWEPGQGSRARTFGALQLALLDQAGNLVQIGHVGSGFTEPDLRDVWGRLSRGDHPIIVEIEYLEVSPSGHLRQPVMKGVRLDIPAAECTVDQMKEGPIE